MSVSWLKFKFELKIMKFNLPVAQAGFVAMNQLSGLSSLTG